MRFIAILLTVFALGACAATPAVPTSEEGKLLEAQELVRYSLTDRVLENVEKNLVEQYTSYLASRKVPQVQAETVVNQEVALLLDAEHQRLLDALVPVYQRYYTADEIHQLLSFYRTDVARKSLQVSSQIAAEIQQPVRLWNENVENVILERVQARLKEQGIPLDN